MKNHAFTIRLRDDKAAQQYKEMHRKVWPEIVGPGGALDTIGVRKLQIFFIEPLTLFMYIEADDDFDPNRDFPRANTLDPRVQEWDDLMHSGDNSLLVRIDHPGPTQWAPMKRIHHVDHTGTLPDLDEE
ncbi:L-rhamnose mutarotase [Micromonospora sp. KC606]|uniref:L-rhamnose mutarotase n=1 Tax=Micromonospora sp. KC606 TaxID=2530379 RepID=UPI0010435303|nr:L-rhamnose mutarotase [Micromonospora sp. KC606]TDC83979.1 L-rhamnose mutarotase [Micromonospora sp. KC606]